MVFKRADGFEPEEENRPLTYLESRFVEEYLIDPTNAAKAAVRAGYSPKTASNIAYNVLKRPKIQLQIEKAREARAERVGITQDRVLVELAKIAFASLGDMITFDEEGNSSIDFRKLTPDQKAAVASIDIKSFNGKTKAQNIKVSLADKQLALVNIGKHLGMFKDKVEVTGTLTLEQMVAGSYGHEDVPKVTNQTEVLEGIFTELPILE